MSIEDPTPKREVDRFVSTETLLILATRPGEETACCGELIATACTLGRPPLVAILTDGSGGCESSWEASRRADEARASVARLGLARERLFLLGLYDGTAPAPGNPRFEQVVSGLAFLMWSRDCNVIVAPQERTGRSDHSAAEAIAATVAERTGVGLLAYSAAAPDDAFTSRGARPERRFRLVREVRASARSS